MKTSLRSVLAVGILSAVIVAPFVFAEKKTAAADFVAHEWGTFTSMQGADGVQFDWNPFVAPELPTFVYNISGIGDPKIASVLPGIFIAGKNMLASRQRMETPVIYFYSEKERTVDVDVQFNGGRITEWYPQLTNAKAQTLRVGTAQMQSRGGMRWTDVQLRPGADEAKLYPRDATGSHYYAARETDAVPLRVTSADGTTQHEKFLFYRGVAGFDAPLKVQQSGDHAQSVLLSNVAKQPLAALFLYSVRGDRAAFVPVGKLKDGEYRQVEFDFEKLARPLAEIRAEISKKMRAALVSEGLYEKEAAAMVKTWDDSWFAEPGTRVLYTLPQQWTDAVLPLTFTPAPKEVRRVFIGRAEMITPAMDWALLREVVRYADGDDTTKAAATRAVRALDLGRFTAPAISRVAQFGPQASAFRNAVAALTESIRPPAPKPLAKAE